ncbi:MAG: Porin [Chthoniobacteraceae bacterium]|nr:Porin [Chthoniobacteraceae bacterium]
MNKFLLAGAASVAFSLNYSFAQESAGVGSPQETSASWWTGSYALGNLGGLRSRLAADGYTFESYYVSDIAGNPSGGRKQGFTYTDNIYFGVTFGLDKIFGWPGGHFLVSFVERDGPSLTNKYVGSIYNSQQVYGGQSFFVYQFLLDQHFLNDKISLKLGRYGASDDFNSSPLYGLYMNNGINGDIRNVLFDTQFSAYPFATWAARLRIDPVPEFNAQVGVFQTWRHIFDSSHHGLDWGIHRDDGVFLIAQFAWTPEFFKKPVPDESACDGKTVAPVKMKGLPGHYWIGGSYSPWAYPQFGRLERSENSYGGYVHADQMVFQEKPGSDQGLILWAASGLYPQEKVSIIPFQVNAGVVYTGLFPTRDEDKTILGLIYGRFSRAYAGTQIFLGNGDPRYELVVEAGYRIQFTKFASIQPDVQYIVNPGGTGRIPDAWVLGAQIGITF